MYEPSPELAAVLQRLMTAFHQRDLDTFENVMSRSAALRTIGTDPREWVSGYEPLIELLRAQLAEIPPFEWSSSEIEAFATGDVGWAAANAEMTLEGPHVFPVRMTLTFALESGVWRVVQWHTSMGQTNEETIGVELTTALEDLLASLGPEVDSQIRSTASEGTVTLVFTDIESSTELSEQLGDRAWADVIGWHDDTMRRVTDSEGGAVVKTLGDGAMLAFESARSAVRSAVGIQQAIASRNDDPPLQVRIGVHTGETVRTDTDYLGNTVNKAARIASAAGGGEIMVSSVVQELVGASANIDFGQPKPVELKGLSGTHIITPVLW